MPELPEVETVRRGLQELMTSRTVATVKSLAPKSFQAAPGDVDRFLIDARVTAVRRRAKVLIIDLSTDYTLVIHLKMTGQLVFVSKNVEDSKLPNSSEPKARFGGGHPNESLIGELPDRSTRVIITFTDGSHLYFNDQRKFGWMKLMPTIEVPNIDFMKKVGPEPLETDFTPEAFAARFKRRAGTSIKAALLDQTVVAGVGNIYADESLWGAKLHPKRLVRTITPAEFERLFHELRSVMNMAIEKGGSTDKNYVNAEGGRGNYLDFARAFRREGQPCPRCGTPIIKFKAAGRGTHTCPVCQPEPS
jgi:formamidopyrimidine-DNA glycosylase